MPTLKGRCETGSGRLVHNNLSIAKILSRLLNSTICSFQPLPTQSLEVQEGLADAQIPACESMMTTVSLALKSSLEEQRVVGRGGGGGRPRAWSIMQGQG